MRFDFSAIALLLYTNPIIPFLESYPDGVIIIYGQTATGKTRLSLELCRLLGDAVEIVSADSRQVYKYMNIGTDKIWNEFRKQIPHHMIDIIYPDEIITAGEWQQQVYQIIPDIVKRNRIPMIVWWTGLYIDTIVHNFNMWVAWPDLAYRRELELLNAKDWWSSLWDMLYGIDPQEASKHHPSSTRFIIRALEIYKQTGIKKSELMIQQQPKFPILMIGLWQDVQIGNKLIDVRLEQMIRDGLVEEVESLLERWYDKGLSSMKSIDYKQTIEYIEKLQILRECVSTDKDSSLFETAHNSLFQEYISSLQIANHQLAKKQRTWFRRYKRAWDHQNSSNATAYDIGINPIVYTDVYLPDFLM